MTATAKMYGQVFLAAFNKEINLLADDIYVSLHTSGYTPDQDADNYYNDVSSQVAAGGGYTTNGKVLTTKTFTYSAGTNKTTFDADDLTWSAASFTARTAVVYDRTPATDATRPLIAYEQNDADVTASGGDWQLTWNASGIFDITAA